MHVSGCDLPIGLARCLDVTQLADRSQRAGEGCPLWYVNSWALGWSRET